MIPRLTSPPRTRSPPGAGWVRMAFAEASVTGGDKAVLICDFAFQSRSIRPRVISLPGVAPAAGSRVGGPPLAGLPGLTPVAASGGLHRVGVLVLGTGHPDISQASSTSQADGGPRVPTRLVITQSGRRGRGHRGGASQGRWQAGSRGGPRGLLAKACCLGVQAALGATGESVNVAWPQTGWRGCLAHGGWNPSLWVGADFGPAACLPSLVLWPNKVAPQGPCEGAAAHRPR